MSLPIDEASPSPYLLSSSLSSPTASKCGSSRISNIYKQASSLFLTRRFEEALSIIEPVVTPTIPSDGANGDEEVDHGGEPENAPIAGAARTTRIKIWSLYLTIVNAVIELGPEEGRNTFGSQRWRGLVSKAKEGSIWDDVVRHGYEGKEGDVDADVIINLATLLLSHARTQSQTQVHLETYLSASAHPNLDISSHFLSGTAEAGPHQRRLIPHDNGTNTPRDLAARIQILELYTLHVLPRNFEWDYAREFISMSEVLDDERREAFLQALQSLKDEQDRDSIKEKALLGEREIQIQMEKEQAEKRKLEDEEQKAKAKRKRTENEVRGGSQRPSSETDYGIEGSNHNKPSQPLTDSNNQSRKSTQSGKSQLSPRPRSSIPSRKPTPGSNTLYKRTAVLVASLQKILIDTTRSMSGSPLALLRMMFFLVALILAFGRRDVRERLKRITGTGWDKIRSTVGMGVKVSYI